MSLLDFPKEPYDLKLSYGVRIKVKPLSTPGMLAAQAAARRRTDKDVDKDSPDREGLYQANLIYELAFRHAVELEVQGSIAPVTEENLKTVLDIYPVGERFFQEFTLQQVILNAAKNGSRVSAAGTSSAAAAQNTAADAKTSD
jgi:hypothetical protein